MCVTLQSMDISESVVNVGPCYSCGQRQQPTTAKREHAGEGWQVFAR
jgi:hypothetical protein